MENKENYIIKLTANNLKQYDINSITSSNVISIEDINDLANNINICINSLNDICTDQFCQLCQNTVDFYVSLTDQYFPRVKYFNNQTGNINAVLANSTINNIPLSDSIVSSINLITQTRNNPFLYVKTINGDSGDLSGIEQIKINGQTYSYTKENKGIINLGNYRQMKHYLSSINGQSGILTLPAGVTYNNVNYFCDISGNVNLTNIFDKFVTSSNLKFHNLYVQDVDQTNTSSVINLKYLSNNTLGCSAITVDVGGTSTLTASVPMMDENFLSFIYALSSNTNVDIVEVSSNLKQLYQRHLYDKGIPLTFIATQNDTKIRFNYSPTNLGLSFSKNYNPYQKLTNNFIDISLSAGEILSLSGIGNTFSNSTTQYTFVINKPVYCYGNIMSLVNFAKNIDNDYQFYGLFNGCQNLLTPPQLPATKLKENCYAYMFSGCSNLRIPPILPATNLAPSCYNHMFEGCTSLSSFPILPATKMEQSCYQHMFKNCTNLTIAPYYLLPAKTLAPSCYYYMFNGCNKITDSPLLPATTLSLSCYQGMFVGCNSLTAIHANLALSDIGNNYTLDWLVNINSNATFYNTEAWNQIKTIKREQYFYYNNRNGNTKYFSELPQAFKIARSLEDTPLSFELISGVSSGAFCFRSIQYNTSTNTYKPYSYKKNKEYVNGMNAHYKYYNHQTKALTGENLDENGWIQQKWDWESDPNKYTLSHESYTFNNFVEHNKIGLIFSLSTNYFSQGFIDSNTIVFWRLCHQKKNCRFKIMGNLNSLIGGRNYINPFQFFSMFSNVKCGDKHYANGFIDAHQLILPTKEIYEGAYAKMFEGCTGLSGIPTTLPINQTAPSCCMDMFQGCTALSTTALQLSTNRLTDLCYANMFAGCSNLTIAPSFNLISAAPSCCINMFKQCSKLKYCQNLITNNISINSYDSMFKNCSSLITPPSLESKTVNVEGCKDMFAGCNHLVYLPPLPMSTIATNCYYNMFQVCSSIISPYVYLPAKKLELNCYYNMFNQTKVKHLVVKFTDWNEEKSSTYMWLSNVPNSGTITCDHLKNIKDSSHVPSTWQLNNSKEIIVTFGEEVNNNIKLIYLRK